VVGAPTEIYKHCGAPCDGDEEGESSCFPLLACCCWGRLRDDVNDYHHHHRPFGGDKPGYVEKVSSSVLMSSLH
jgi:hypothetical protein